MALSNRGAYEVLNVSSRHKFDLRRRTGTQTSAKEDQCDFRSLRQLRLAQPLIHRLCIYI